jgi:NAD(P)-dependent dehydrogenase (short-subunit alcohol dehydrogenase family)
LITGGASGIGEGTVRHFVAEGARVVIADMQQERGEKLAAELGANALFTAVDVTREDQVKAAIAGAVTRWGRLDCIFNNAGFGGAIGPLEDTPVEDFDITFDVLLKGVFLGMKHAIPVMKRQGGGSIINTASVAGLIAGHTPHLYSVAKGR